MMRCWKFFICAMFVVACMLSSCTHKSVEKISYEISKDSLIIADEIHLLEGFGVADDCDVKLYAKHFVLGACKLETRGSLELNGIGPNAVVTASEGFEGFSCSSGSVSLGAEVKMGSTRRRAIQGTSSVGFTGLEFQKIRTGVFISASQIGVSVSFSRCVFNETGFVTLLYGRFSNITMDRVTFRSSEIDTFCCCSDDLPLLELRGVKTENCVLQSLLETSDETANFPACGRFTADACVLKTKKISIYSEALRITETGIVSESATISSEDFCLERSLLNCGVLELSCGNSRIVKSAIFSDEFKFKQVMGFLPVESALFSTLLMCPQKDLESFLRTKTPHHLDGAMLIPKEASLSNPVSISIPSTVLSSTSHSLFLCNLQLEGEIPPTTGVVVHQITHEGKAYIFAFDYCSKRNPTHFPPFAEAYRNDVEQLLKIFSDELPNSPFRLLFYVGAMSWKLRQTYYCESLGVVGH